MIGEKTSVRAISGVLFASKIIFIIMFFHFLLTGLKGVPEPSTLFQPSGITPPIYRRRGGKEGTIQIKFLEQPLVLHSKSNKLTYEYNDEQSLLNTL